MKSDTKKLGLLIGALLISFNCAAENRPTRFQLAVVEYAAGSKDIMKGRYDQGLQKLVKASSNTRVLFEVSTGICAAKAMSDKLEQAKPYCNQAVNVYKDRTNSQYQYLTSIAYSNRGIVRFKLGDVDGASKDLEMAVSIDQNKIVKSNLVFLKSQLTLDPNETLQIASE
jgi:Tfp pilus assembly protein PilF